MINSFRSWLRAGTDWAAVGAWEWRTIPVAAEAFLLVLVAVASFLEVGAFPERPPAVGEGRAAWTSFLAAGLEAASLAPLLLAAWEPSPVAEEVLRVVVEHWAFQAASAAGVHEGPSAVHRGESGPLVEGLAAFLESAVLSLQTEMVPAPCWL